MYRGTGTWRIVAGAAALTLLAGACGDDDDADVADATTTTEAADDATTTTAADTETAGGGEVNPEFADYCAIAVELDAQEEFPSAEQLEQIRAAAPDEISDEINTAVDAFLAAIEADGTAEAAFDDPAVQQAFQVIEPFEEQNCGIDHGD
jgi:hypothetical protein